MSERETIRTTTTRVDLSGCLLPIAVVYGGAGLLLLIALITQAVIYG